MPKYLYGRHLEVGTYQKTFFHSVPRPNADDVIFQLNDDQELNSLDLINILNGTTSQRINNR